MLDIWEIDVNDHNIKIAQRYKDILSDIELYNLHKFKFFRDYSRYLVAHVAMRLLLAKYNNIKANAIIYSYGKYGKPYLTGNILFNLSHSHKKIIIGVCKKDIGVDIEYKKDIDHNSVGNMVFTKEEKFYISSGNTQERFYALWTKKEAVVKAIGIGLNMELKNLFIGTKDSCHYKNNLWQIAKIKSSANYIAYVSYKNDYAINDINHFILDLDNLAAKNISRI